MDGQCTVFWSFLNEKFLEETYENHIKSLPQIIQKRLNKYPKKHDKYLSLLGKLLLFKALEKSGENASKIFETLKYSPKGRPYFEKSSFDFNISHSTDIITCAFSTNRRVGIDVQRIIPVSVRQAQFFVNISDLKDFNVEQESEKLIEIWTRKEAVSKVLGDGLSISFRKMLLSKDRYKVSKEEEIFIYPCTLKAGYSCSLASQGRLNKIDLHFIPEEELVTEHIVQAP